MHSITITTEPTAEPITTAEAKTHMRVDISDDDTYIGTLITAARKTIERETSMAFCGTIYTLYLPCFYQGMTLPRWPVNTIDTITYYDSDGDSQTLSSAVYQYNTSDKPVRLYTASGQSWPDTDSDRLYAVEIAFTAGYSANNDTEGDQQAAVPQDIKLAIKMLAAHWYEHREPVIDGGSVGEVPRSVDAIIDSFKWSLF